MQSHRVVPSSLHKLQQVQAPPTPVTKTNEVLCLKSILKMVRFQCSMLTRWCYHCCNYSNEVSPKNADDDLGRSQEYVRDETMEDSDQISRSVVSDSLRPHESQHARPPYPSPEVHIKGIILVSPTLASSHTQKSAKFLNLGYLVFFKLPAFCCRYFRLLALCCKTSI